VEKGLKVRLEGGGGTGCQTENGLDHPDVRDYGSGSTPVFDGQPDQGQTDGLTNCYKDDLQGAVTGGAVTWLGTGLFSPRNRKICVTMSGQSSPWCCNMASSSSSQDVAVSLQDCKQS